MEEDAAFFQIDGATGGFEGENGVGTDAGDGIVRCGQFHARGGAGANKVRRFEKLVGFGRSGGLCGGSDDFGVVDDFSKNAFGERRSGARYETDAYEQSQEEECGFNVYLGVLGLRASLHPEMSCQRNKGVNDLIFKNGSTAVQR